MTRYAEHTTVPSTRTRLELDTLLARHGATQRGTMTDELRGRAIVIFRLAERSVQLSLALRSADQVYQDACASPPHGWKSWKEPARRRWATERAAQDERQRWRALLLCTRAKLEMIAEGHSTVEAEFLAHIVLPDGRTVGEAVAPHLTGAPGGLLLPEARS